MGPFSYFPNIPDGPNDPADDQPLMKTNYASIQGLINVDHVDFAESGAGEHNQVTFNDNNPPAAPIGTKSVLYTNPGVAATDPQLFWQNLKYTSPLSSIRAFGSFVGNFVPGLIAPINSFNVSTINCSLALPATYVITLTTNCTDLNSAVVLITMSPSAPAYTFTFVMGVLTIVQLGTPTALNINFLVLQA